MPLAPRGASYHTSVVKASSEVNGAIGGAVARGGNSLPPRPSGEVASIVKNNIVAQILFRELDNMPGPPGPPGPPGSGGSFSALATDIWGGSPPATAEEAINRLAVMLYTRTFTQGPLAPVPNNTQILTLGTAGISDAFVVKYASDGTPMWARRIGGVGTEQGMGVSAMSSGEVYVTGFAFGAATVFAADDSTTALSFRTAGSRDAFVVKYASDGTPTWVRRFGALNDDRGMGVSAMSSGEVYVTGFAAGTALITNFL